MNRTSELSPVAFLLVADFEDDLLALEARLERPELVLLKARSGREALKLLSTHDVALALIDVHLSEMGGFELAEAMRRSEATRRVPIILLTDAGERERAFSGHDAAAVELVSKPFESRVLRQKTEPYFQLYRQRQQLSALRAELEETLRFDETFTSVVSHDLRNPLNVISMGTESLLRSLTEPAHRKTAERVRINAQRMVSLLDDLSDLARARSGGITVHPQPTDLLALANKVVDEQRGNHQGRVIELSTHGSFDGEWDAQRIEQIIRNLLTNALRHGAPDAAIAVRLDGAAGPDVELSIANQGHIEPELLPHVFRPFRSGRTARRASEGLGLGLYLSRTLAEAHGGSLEIDSSAELGTTVRVRLPRKSPKPLAANGPLVF